MFDSVNVPAPVLVRVPVPDIICAMLIFPIPANVTDPFHIAG